MHISKAKQLIKTVEHRIDRKRSVLPQIQKFFVINWNSTCLVDRDSLSGRVAAFIHRNKNDKKMGEEIQILCSQALKSLQGDFSASPETRFLLSRELFKKNPESSARQAIAGNVKSPIQSQELDRLGCDLVISRSEALDEIKKKSFFHNPHLSETFTAKEASHLLENSDLSVSLPILHKYLKKHPELACAHLETCVEEIQKGLLNHEILAHQIDSTSIQMLAKEVHGEIQRLEPGKKWILPIRPSSERALSILLKSIPESQLDGFPSEFGYSLKNGKLPDPKEFSEKLATKAFAEIQSLLEKIDPALKTDAFQSLFEKSDRSLPESIHKFLPRFLETRLEQWMNEGLLKQAQIFVPEGKFRDFLGWLGENGHKIHDPKERASFLLKAEIRFEKALKSGGEEALDQIKKRFHTSIIGMAENLQSGLAKDFPLSDIHHMLGVDASEYWIEIQRTTGGQLDFHLYATGSALSRYNVDKNGKKLQWPITIKDIDPNKLSSCLLERLLFATFLADESDVPKEEILFEGVVKALQNGSKSPEKPIYQTLEPGSLKGIGQLLALLQKKDENLSSTLLHIKMEALSAFVKPLYTKNGQLEITESSALSILENEIENIEKLAIALSDELDQNTKNSILAAKKELQIASASFKRRPKPRPSKTILPPLVIKEMKKKLQEENISIDHIQSVRSILTFALGDEIGNVIDALAEETGLKATSPIGDIKKAQAPHDYPHKAGWLLTLFNNVYFQVAASALKWALIASSLLHANPLAVAYLLLSNDWILEKILPSDLYKWYIETLSAIENAIRDIVLSIVLRCFFSFSFAQKLKSTALAWQKNIQGHVDQTLQKRQLEFHLNTPAASPPKKSNLWNSSEGTAIKPAALPPKKNKLWNSSEGTAIKKAATYNRTLPEFFESHAFFEISQPKTPDALLAQLKELDSREAHSLKNSNDPDILSYLIQRVEVLEIPKKNDACVWNHIKPEEALDLLSRLSLLLAQECPPNLPESELNRKWIAQFHLLSIIDAVARRCPGSGMENYSTPIHPLLHFISQRGPIVTDPSSNEKLRKIVAYFEPRLDFDRFTQDHSYQNEWKKHFQRTIFFFHDFHFDNASRLLFMNDLHPEIEYLKTRLNDPQTKKRLRDLKVAENTSKNRLLEIMATASLDFRSKYQLVPRGFIVLQQHLANLAEGLQRKTPHYVDHDTDFSKIIQKKEGWLDTITQQLDQKASWLGNNLFIPIVNLFSKLQKSNYPFFSPDLPLPYTANVARSQSEITSKPLVYPLLQFDDAEEKRLFEQIFCEKTDQVLRAIHFIEKYPDTIRNTHKWALVQHAVFGIEHLKKQLLDSPKTVETLKRVLEKTYRFHLDSNQTKDALSVLHMGILIYPHIACYLPAHLSEFWNFKETFSHLLGKPVSQPLRKRALELRALLVPRPTLSMSKEEKDKYIDLILEARFAPLPQSDAGAYPPVAGFHEKFLEWSEVIWKEVTERNSRNALLKRTLEKQGMLLDKVESSNLGFWIFECGALFINFFQGTITSDTENPSDLEGLEKAFSIKMGKNIGPLKPISEGVYGLPDPSYTLQKKQGRYYYFRKFENKSYRHIGKAAPDLITPLLRKGESVASIWLEENATKEKQVLVEYERGTFQKIDISCDSNNFDSFSFSIRNIRDSKDQQLIPLNPSNLDTLLSPLYGFCPQESILSFSSPDGKRLQRIILSTHSLSFEVKEEEGQLKAYSSDYPGFFLAPLQKHPLGTDLGSQYLVLQNNKKQQKLLIAQGDWFSSFATRMMKECQFTGPLAEAAKEFVCQKMGKQKTSSRFFSFDVTHDGDLESSCPEALSHLFSLQLIQNNLPGASRALEGLMQLAKRAPLPQEVFDHFTYLALLPPSMKEVLSLRKKLLVLMEENRRLFPLGKNDPKPEVRGAAHLAYLSMALVDLSAELDIRNEQSRTARLSEADEWLLFEKAMHHLDEWLQLADPDLSAVIQMVGPDTIIDLFGLSPKLSTRYRELKEKYKAPDSLLNKGARTIRDLLSAPSLIPTSLLSSKELFTKENQKKILQWAFKTLGERPNFTVSAVSNSPSIQNFSKKLEEDFTYYYACARGEKSTEEQKELEQLLILYKGGWDKKSALLIEYLKAALKVPKIFPSSKAFLKELEETNALKLSLAGTEERQKLKAAGSDTFDRIHTLYKSYTAAQLAAGLASHTLSSFASKKFISSLPQTLLGLPKIPLWLEYGINASAHAAQALLSRKGDIKENPSGPYLGASSFASLDDEDLRIDRALDKEIEHIFEKENEDPPKKIAPFSTKSQEPAELERFQRVNKSLNDYESLQGSRHGYRLKNRAAIFESYFRLEACREELQQHLIEEREALLRVVNPETIPQMLTFEDLLRFFQTGNFSSLSKELNLPMNRIDLLEIAIARHIIKTTRLKHLERILTRCEELATVDTDTNKEEYRDKLEAFLDELQARRGYSFQKTPAKIARRFMIFEIMSENMLWKKQSDAIQKLLNEASGEGILELLMSLGKTYFGIPTINAIEANKKQLVVNIWPEPLADTNTRQIAKQSKKIFGQIVNLLHFSRGKKELHTYLDMAYFIFKRALEEGETVHMTKQDAQALELLLIDHLYRIHSTPAPSQESLAALKRLQEMLTLLRTQAKAVGDEAHELFNRREELNYPVGPKSAIGSSYYNLIETCFRFLASDKEWLKLAESNDLSLLSKEDYQKRIVPGLAKKIFQMILPSGCALEENEFFDYVSGRGTSIPAWISKHPRFSEIALLKGLLTTLFPMVFSKAVSVDFGLSNKNHEDSAARPYSGNSNCQERASIKSPYEALVKTFLIYFHKGLSADQISRMIKKMQSIAYIQARKMKLPIKETDIYQVFHSIAPDADLENFDSPQNRIRIQKAFQKNHDAICLFIQLFASQDIRYWKKNVRSDALNFDSMFRSRCYDTGTPYNDGCFPADLPVLWDPGTAGEALQILSQKCPQDGVVILTKKDPEGILQEVLQKDFQPHSDYSAIIDGSALLKGMENITVAKAMLEHCKKHQPDIEAIVFFHRQKEGTYRLMALSSGDSEPTPLESCSAPPNKRLTYYDHSHIFGADIDQPKSGKGRFLAEKITLNRLLQGVFRFRGIKKFDKVKTESSPLQKNQSVQFAISQETAEKIAPGRKPTLRDLIAYAIQNEAELAADDNYQAYRHKIHNTIRRAVLDKLLQAPSETAMIAIFRDFEDVLVQENDDDPRRLFGPIETEIEPAKALHLAKLAAFTRIQNSRHFTTEEKKAVKATLDGLPQPPMPKMVRLSQSGDKVELGLNDHLGKEVQVEQENENEQENEQENENENELQNQVQNQLGSSLFQEKTWNQSALATNRSEWMRFYTNNENPMLFGIDRLFHEAGGSFSAVGKIIDQRLSLTNNFFPVHGSDTQASLGSELQRDLYQTLVFLEPKGDSYRVVSTLCLSQKEAALWREKVKKQSPHQKEIAILYDVQLRTIASGPDIPLEALKKSTDFMNLEVQLRFFNGEANYPRELRPALKAWILKNKLHDVKDVFHRLHAKRGSYKGSDIERIFNEIENPLEKNHINSRFPLPNHKPAEPSTLQRR